MDTSKMESSLQSTDLKPLLSSVHSDLYLMLIFHWLDACSLRILDNAIIGIGDSNNGKVSEKPGDVELRKAWLNILSSITDSKVLTELEYDPSWIQWVIDRRVRISRMQICPSAKKGICGTVFHGIYISSLETIDLSGCTNVRDSSISDLVIGCQHLLSITLKNCVKLTDVALVAIGNHCPRLKVIDISRCENVTDAGVTALTLGCSVLQSISVSSCNFVTEISMKALAQRCLCLSSVNFGCCPISNLGITLLLQGCSQLQSICLNNFTRLSDITMALIADCCISLVTIDISYCTNVSDIGIEALTHGCAALQSINFSGCSGLTDTSMRAVAHRCPRLREIDISQCANITDSGVVPIASGCPDLLTIMLGDCHRLTDATLVSIGRQCCKLTKIDIKYCAVSDEGISALADGCRLLQSINISHCNLTDASITCIGQSCHGLLSIDTSYNAFTDIGMIALLNGCPLLNCVTFCHKLTDISMHALGQQCRSLSLLNIFGCTDITASGVMDLLQRCTLVKILILDCRYFDERDRRALSEMYPHLTCF